MTLIVLGVKLYIDYEKFNNNLNDLIQCIIKEIEVDSNKAIDQKTQDVSLVRVASAGHSKYSKIVISWNNYLVNQWLNDRKLKEFIVVFDGATGETLFTLWEMKQKDYSVFLITIDKLISEAKATVKTIIKLNFIKALDDLFKG